MNPTQASREAAERIIRIVKAEGHLAERTVAEIVQQASDDPQRNMSKNLKALILSSIPEYCDWKNVSAVYLVPVDFNYDKFRNDTGREFGIWERGRTLSEGQEIMKNFQKALHERLAAMFQSLEFDEGDYE